MSDDLKTDAAILNGEEVEIAPLATIDFYKLADNDVVETQRLLDCCINDGFFYLNLQGPHPSSKIIADQDMMFSFMKDYFNQSDEVKMVDNIGSMTDG